MVCAHSQVMIIHNCTKSQTEEYTGRAGRCCASRVSNRDGVTVKNYCRMRFIDIASNNYRALSESLFIYLFLFAHFFFISSINGDIRFLFSFCTHIVSWLLEMFRVKQNAIEKRVKTKRAAIKSTTQEKFSRKKSTHKTMSNFIFKVILCFALTVRWSRASALKHSKCVRCREDISRQRYTRTPVHDTRRECERTRKRWQEQKERKKERR